MLFGPGHYVASMGCVYVLQSTNGSCEKLVSQNRHPDLADREGSILSRYVFSPGPNAVNNRVIKPSTVYVL